MKPTRYSSEAQEKLRITRHRRWVQKSISVHEKNFSYDNSLCSFTTAKATKVQLTCKRHDLPFLVYPEKHLQNKNGGCQKCQDDYLRAISIEKSKKKFLPWFERNCADRLLISSKVGLLTEKIKVICRLHGTERKIEPTVLMTTKAFACDHCVSDELKTRNRLTMSKIKESLQGQLPESVLLKNIKFNEKKSQTEIIFHCSIHGKQKPVTLVHARRSNSVCLDCGKLNRGYASYRLENLIRSKSAGKLTTIGIMEVEVFGIKGLKVGITTRSLRARYSFYLRNIFLSAQLHEIDALVLENQIKLNFSEHKDERIKKFGMRQGERWSGDTEIFWFRKKEKIIAFTNKLLQNLVKNKPNYSKELARMVVDVSSESEINRIKSTLNIPIPVVGVDPTTGKVKKEFSSLSEAQRNGYQNLSTVLSTKYSRNYSGGLRWFKQTEFNPKKLPSITFRNYFGKPIRCIETSEVFLSTIHAEKIMKDRGFKISASKVSAVLNGSRKTAGGFSWERVDPKSSEVRMLMKAR